MAFIKVKMEHINLTQFKKALKLASLILVLFLYSGCFTTYSRFRNYDARIGYKQETVSIGYTCPINHSEFHDDRDHGHETEVGEGLSRMLSSLVFQKAFQYNLKMTIGLSHASLQYQFFERNNWFLSSELLFSGYYSVYNARGFLIEPNIITTYQFPLKRKNYKVALSTGVALNRHVQRVWDQAGFQIDAMGSANYTRTHQIVTPFSCLLQVRRLKFELGMVYIPYRWNYYEGTALIFHENRYFDSFDVKESSTSKNQLSILSSIGFDF